MDDAKLAEIADEVRAGRGRRLRGAVLAGACAIVALVACGDPYLHTNPYDPAFPVTFDIVGPDTLFSFGEFAQYSVSTIPAFPDTSFRWDIDTATVINARTGMDTVVDGASVFRPSGPGGYVSILPPTEPATVTIAVVALIGAADTTLARYEPCCGDVTIQTSTYRHVGYKKVVLTQRLTRIQLRCPDTHSCDTLSVGGTWSVWVDGFDALGRQPPTLTSSSANPRVGPPVVTYTVRDTTIAISAPNGTRAATVTALRSGSTWIVATRGALADSLQLVVQ